MPRRFYFHLESQHEVIRDDQGVEADDGERALQLATEAVEEMRQSGELPTTGAGWSLAVTDDHGRLICKITI